MNFDEIDISTLIPQQRPFVMVEKLLYCDWKTTKTLLSIRNENIFVENGALSQSGIIENVAQTCATRMGYLGDSRNIKIGMIGSIDDFEFSGILPEVGQKIATEITVETEIGRVILLNASVLCDKIKIADGKMKVVLTDTDAG